MTAPTKAVAGCLKASADTRRCGEEPAAQERADDSRDEVMLLWVIRLVAPGRA